MTLLVRGLQITNTCVMCGEASETLVRCFLKCPYMISCWNCIQLEIPVSDPTSLGDWFMGILDRRDQEFARKVGSILWGIWRQRNSKLWNNTYLLPHQNVHGALTFCKEWGAFRIGGSPGFLGGNYVGPIRWSMLKIFRKRFNNSDLNRTIKSTNLTIMV